VDTSIHFNAPWSVGLRRVSLLSVGVFAVGIAAGIIAWQRTGEPLALLAIAMLLLILLACALCMIKGYALTDEEIVVKRLGWTTCLPLDGLQSVTGDNEAMIGSVRLFANGGVLSYTGYFWNRKIGRYRALATDPSRAIVLRYAKRKIVITPDDPQRFIVRARTAMKNRGAFT
jgi:hypothetical protein